MAISFIQLGWFGKVGQIKLTIPDWILSRAESLDVVEVERLSDCLENPFWEGAVVGSSAVSKRRGRYRTFKALLPGGQWLPGLPGVGGGCAARWGLEIAFKRAGIKAYSFKKWLNRTYRPFLSTPMYCLEGVHPAQGYYLDVKGCFWNIYRRFPIFCAYDPQTKRFFSAGASHEELLPDEWGEMKLVRNSLPGLWRAGRVVTIKGGRLHTRELNYTPQRSLSHWLLLWEVLQDIAWHAVRKFKACYYHTDGGIWLEPWLQGGWDWACWLYEKYGLETNLKAEGYCTISGLCRYQFDSIPRPAPSASRGVDSIPFDEPLAPVALKFF